MSDKNKAITLKNFSSSRGLGLALFALAAPSHAIETSIGDTDISIQTQLTAGVSWRMESPDARLIGANNSTPNNTYVGDSSTTDDGNLNFEKGDVFSSIIKGSTDIRIERENYGAFVRAKYWYDHELENGKRPHGHSPNGYEPNAELDDSNFSDTAKFSGVKLMDAFVYGDFELGDTLLNVRLGRQVVSWGESTFIQGGINSINPIDVSAFRRPGAELKEGLLPVGMLFANLGVTENLSIEGFYQYEWEETQIDGCGTYFSSNDFGAEGCFAVTAGAPGLTDSQLLNGVPFPPLPGLTSFYAQRVEDRTPDDDGQYGIAFRYFAPELNETEFGFYYMNIHSRLPLISGVTSVLPVVDGSGNPLFGPGNTAPAFTGDQETSARYFIDYPEDLKIMGMSFATNVGGVALSGEVSYKPDTPIQINGNEVIAAAFLGIPFSTFFDNVAAAGTNAVARGWEAFDVTQAQMTAIGFFDQILGASRLTLIGEVGATYVDDLPDTSVERFGRNSVFGASFQSNPNGGYVTDVSWGYRLRGQLEYSDVFAGVNLKPSLAFSHDVEGYSPEPAQQFNEGRKAVGVTLAADYLNQYTASISYVDFFGGDYNATKDRDFASFSVGYAF